MALDSNPFLICPLPPRGGTTTSKTESLKTASKLFRFVLFCSWMSNIHELSRQLNGDGSLTHSILNNLFIKLQLSNFHLPPLLSIVFVQECSVVLRKVWRGETREAYIFVESQGKSLSSASKFEDGHYGFHVVLFRKYVVFWLSAFAHTSMKAGRGIYDRDDVSFTIARRRPQFIRWIILKLKSFYDFFKICN